jgi:hypothetical protein
MIRASCRFREVAVDQVEGQPNAPFRRRANQSQVAGKFAQMPGPSLLWVPSQSKKAKRKRGERKRGSIVPPRSYALRTAQQALWHAAKGEGAIRNSLSMFRFARPHWAALCAARVGVHTAVGVAIGDKRGVSDPHFAAPFFARSPAQRGSLTPHLRVSFVRSPPSRSRTVSASRGAGPPHVCGALAAR